MKKLVLASAALMLGASAQAQSILREGSTPSPATEAVASVGSTVFEKFRYAVLPAFEIADRVTARIIFAEVDIPAGAKLVQINSKTKLKACYVLSIEEVVSQYYRGCLMDDDGDGTFDRVAGNEVQGGKKMAPVRYVPSEIILPTATQNFRQVVTYLGAANNTLRLSYREFMNDMARPAFTEEYTFPLAATFPQPIAFKDVKLTVTGVDGAGLHYRVEP